MTYLDTIGDHLEAAFQAGMESIPPDAEYQRPGDAHLLHLIGEALSALDGCKARDRDRKGGTRAPAGTTPYLNRLIGLSERLADQHRDQGGPFPLDPEDRELLDRDIAAVRGILWGLLPPTADPDGGQGPLLYPFIRTLLEGILLADDREQAGEDRADTRALLCHLSVDCNEALRGTGRE